MISMTKFDKDFVAFYWLRILKIELAGPHSLCTLSEKADVSLEGCAKS